VLLENNYLKLIRKQTGGIILNVDCDISVRHILATQICTEVATVLSMKNKILKKVM
jgi:hypothetical protein